MSASDCFGFRICFKGPKNNKYVFFHFDPFAYLGGEPLLKIHKKRHKFFYC